MKLTGEDKRFLELYSDSVYEKPSVTVDSVVLRLKDIETDNYRKLPEKALQVYLLKREYSPYKNAYALPGTFIDLNFELGDTVRKCLKSKIGLENFYCEQLYTFGEKQRDPRTRVIGVSYLALTNSYETLSGGDWFDIDMKTVSSKRKETKLGFSMFEEIELKLSNQTNTLRAKIEISIENDGKNETKKISIKNSDLAFDHAKIIFYAIKRLQGKLEYTDIIFHLLPSLFTLTELKLGYEKILGKKLLDANFRRKIKDMVEPTEEFVKDLGHRPSQLFKLNPLWNYNNFD